MWTESSVKVDTGRKLMHLDYGSSKASLGISLHMPLLMSETITLAQASLSMMYMMTLKEL